MSWFERRYVFRRIALIGSMLICGWTTYQMFADITLISTAAAAAYATATALFGAAVGFYFKKRGE